MNNIIVVYEKLMSDNQPHIIIIYKIFLPNGSVNVIFSVIGTIDHTHLGENDSHMFEVCIQ